jgi:SAM-dependent methyltransferase
MAITRAMLRAGPYACGVLVDIGCGLCPYHKLFTPYIRHYIGVDYPPHQGITARIDGMIHADSLFMPLRDASVDTVLSTQVLEHVPDPTQMLGEARRILRPGGILIMTAPFVWAEHEVPRDFYRYTSYGLRHLLTHVGLRPLVVEPLDGLYAVLGQLWLDELNLGRHTVRGWRRWLLTMANRSINGMATVLDSRFPSPRICLTWLVIAQRVDSDCSTCAFVRRLAPPDSPRQSGDDGTG